MSKGAAFVEVLEKYLNDQKEQETFPEAFKKSEERLAALVDEIWSEAKNNYKQTTGMGVARAPNQTRYR